jgi:NAD(P)-dependent dehydrogenase (short-subunit alcohol dehydrogenase family)
MPTPTSSKQLLLIGASRGLGFALADEYLKRGWRVVATERSRSTSKLHHLLGAADDRLEIETVDINYPDQVAALRVRLASSQFDMLFVNAGIGTRDTVADISTDEFVHMMVTNALSPMRVVESLQDLVLPTGTIGIMSSGQGSITNNANGALMIRERYCSWRRAGCERNWEDPRRV